MACGRARPVAIVVVPRRSKPLRLAPRGMFIPGVLLQTAFEASPAARVRTPALHH